MYWSTFAHVNTHVFFELVMVNLEMFCGVCLMSTLRVQVFMVPSHFCVLI